MASDNIDSDYSVESEDSDVCSLPEYDIEEEDGDLEVTPSKSEESLDSCGLADADEPIADEEWLEEHEKKQKANVKCFRKDSVGQHEWIPRKSLSNQTLVAERKINIQTFF